MIPSTIGLSCPRRHQRGHFSRRLRIPNMFFKPTVFSAPFLEHKDQILVGTVGVSKKGENMGPELGLSMRPGWARIDIVPIIPCIHPSLCRCYLWRGAHDPISQRHPTAASASAGRCCRSKWTCRSVRTPDHAARRGTPCHRVFRQRGGPL